MSNASILLVDDETDILAALRRVLRKQNFDVYTAPCAADALALLQTQPVDIIMSDLNMPGMDGIALLAQVAEKYPDTIRVMLTAYNDVDLILKSINEGRVWGYLQKPWDNNELVILLKQALRARHDAVEKAILKRTLMRYQSSRKTRFEGFIGDSVVMQFVYSAIEKAAPSNASVFITGPSGSGKEVAAHAIHQLSKRKDNPFIIVNCAAIPNELMESEIFGHVKGAFSGATSDRKGMATLADGGTLFLDELGEMDILLQAKLLRFIQTGEFTSVGSGKMQQVNVRFIAATNRDPMVAISEQRLREDLFYRLNVIGIDMPALKFREDDVIQLANSFLKVFSQEEEKAVVGFSDAAQRLLLNYDWPGNIRQLRNAIHSSVIMSESKIIEDTILKQQLKIDQHQPAMSQSKASATNGKEPEVQAPLQHDSNQEQGPILPLAVIERQAIERAIAACEENVVQAASALGVSPSTLYRKIQNWQE
ncbi:sigma-54-dependent Fis family transcriptional regulator [Alteromonas sediminis]|uniref:Sigma-54-dependent Fis family transcriptional regulator n=1 Tax=Alteromonas sediminis TaxID=2259342 RepID=A0A3N5YQS0_9ALTE|nr:sigma-54 dependent transcriptional regulator [Alteromonas sediminis]RPJ68591.1 sigma-54-dependent Fis family transcriptional regulator [Alteromonas sediminis]